MANLKPNSLLTDHSYYELQVLDKVSETPTLTNRQVASILGVSIKLAHDILSRMVEKGYFHVKKHHARRWDYFLTPSGIAKKARLTMEFLDFSMLFYREARKRSAQLCRDLSEAGTPRVSLLGAGNLAEIAYLGMQEWRLDLVAVYDDQRRQPFMGVPVSPTGKLAEDTADAIIVCLYNADQPMGHCYLPEGVDPLPTMRWIFRETEEKDPAS